MLYFIRIESKFAIYRAKKSPAYQIKNLMYAPLLSLAIHKTEVQANNKYNSRYRVISFFSGLHATVRFPLFKCYKYWNKKRESSRIVIAVWKFNERISTSSHVLYVRIVRALHYENKGQFLRWRRIDKINFKFFFSFFFKFCSNTKSNKKSFLFWQRHFSQLCHRTE